jgi:hypothetical protein
MKISELFKDFAHALEIDEATIDEAVRLHERARAVLEANLEGCKRTALSGSYPRNTRLAPLDDIDIIAVVKSTAPWDDDPETALRAAGQIVVDEFPGSTMEIGNHAAKISNIDSTIEDVHLDIVVGYEIGSGTTLKISETQPEPAWIESNPEAHARELSDANAASNDKLKPTIKQVKHWNNREPDGDRQIPSFLIEAIALHEFGGSGSLSPQAMAHRYFDRAAEKIKTPTPSPAVPNGHVDPDMEESRRADLSQRLRRAATRAKEALDIEDDDPDGAHEIWYEIFGDPFPKPDSAKRAADLAAHLRKTPAGSVAGGTTTTSEIGRQTVPGRAYGEES